MSIEENSKAEKPDMKEALKKNPGKDMLDWVKRNLNVPKEVASARLEICKNCDQYRQTTRTCKACNCFLPGKVNINMSTCPKDKWGPS